MCFHHVLVTNDICANMCTYTIMVCTDAIATSMCPCVPLAISRLACHWVNGYVDVMFISVDII